MFELIKQGIGYYNDLTKANPWMVALLLPIVSAVIFWVRNIPTKLWNLLVRHTTTTLQMNNTGWSGNEMQYNAFMKWYMSSPWAKFSRSMSLQHTDAWRGDNSALVGPGRGNHFFIWKGRLFWFAKTNLESSGSERQKEEIELVCLGRSHAPLRRLIDHFKYVEPEESIGIFNLTKEGWRRMASIVRRPLKSVCINPEIKDHLTKQIDRFVQKKEWFFSKGLPHKLTVLLYGIPGSGKTSLVQAVASHYKRNIMVLDLSVLDNAALQSAIAALPKGCILLLEDIDAQSGAVNTRESKPTVVQSSIATLAVDNPAQPAAAVVSGGLEVAAPVGPIVGFGLNRADSLYGVTLSGLLNTLQGVIALDDIMVFMTTNHPEKLDAALIRSSRVDCKYEIGEMQNEQIHEYVANMYDEPLDSTVVFNPAVGSDIQTAFLEHPHDVNAFVKMVGTAENKLKGVA